MKLWPWPVLEAEGCRGCSCDQWLQGDPPPHQAKAAFTTKRWKSSDRFFKVIIETICDTPHLILWLINCDFIFVRELLATRIAHLIKGMGILMAHLNTWYVPFHFLCPCQAGLTWSHVKNKWKSWLFLFLNSYNCTTFNQF